MENQPSPYELASRRAPGEPPVSIVDYNKAWAMFKDKETDLSYFMSRQTGECTYAQPPHPPPSTNSAPVQAPARPTEEHFADAMQGKKEDVVLDPPEEEYPGSASGFADERFDTSSYIPSTNIRDIDMNLFKACRDGKAETVLNHLVGKGADFHDPDLFSDVNVGWHAKRTGLGWDAVPSEPPFDVEPTSFFWAAGTEPGGGEPEGAKRAVTGDTLLHIALKTKRKDIVRWLASTDSLDLNAVNAKGETPAIVADMLGLTSMYTYYFVLK